MKGRHVISITSRKATYFLELERKISVIKGKSGTGKSSVIRLLADFLELGKDSGIKVSVGSSALLMVLTNASKWETILSEVENTVIFIDEDVRFLYDLGFQRALWDSDCYAVIVSRSGMFTALPFAVSSVYKLVTQKSGNATVTKMYRLYEEKIGSMDFDFVLTEDSNSGFEMAELAFNGERTDVVSANGNSNVQRTLLECADNYSNICVNVDGAAFGGFIEPVLKIAEIKGNVLLAAPESFEYLLLKSDIFKKYLSKDSEELTKTYDHCDCKEYITWERYYEALIEKLSSKHLGFTYSKRTLNPYFKTDKCAKDFLSELGKFFVVRRS